MNLADALVIDNFAGGGGASTGIEEAIGRPIDVALNHDEPACAMYRANHPGTTVLCQSVFKADPRDVQRQASERRGSKKLLPVGLAWFSPDCTDHSKAKGAAPIRNRHSRDLAWVVVHWAELVRPWCIMMENVEEWLGWGPLRQRRWPDGRLMFDLHSNPVLERDPDREGQTFRKWRRRMRKAGYRLEFREQRGSHFGAPTIRKRLFMIAVLEGHDIIWPEPSHGPGLLPYRVAAECIDWSIPCPSIFDRERPLVDATLRRIARGVMRYVVNCAEPFIIPITHQGDDRVYSSREPFRTLTTAHRGEFALIAPSITKFNRGATGHRVDVPLHTITCAHSDTRPGGSPPLGVVAAFLEQANTGMVGHDAREPASTIVTKGCTQRLIAASLTKFNGTALDGQPMTEPLGTVRAAGQHHGLVAAFIQKYYSEGGQDQDLRDPLHTATTKARMGLVTITIDGELWVITDIGMRMLTPRELFRAQGFPESYIIDVEWTSRNRRTGRFYRRRMTKTEQVRMVGNSVNPPISRAMVRAQFGITEPLERRAA